MKAPLTFLHFCRVWYTLTISFPPQVVSSLDNSTVKGSKYQELVSHIDKQENAHIEAWVWKKGQWQATGQYLQNKSKNMNKLQNLTQKWSLVFEDVKGCLVF